jgi:hypothetical protein
VPDYWHAIPSFSWRANATFPDRLPTYRRRKVHGRRSRRCICVEPEHARAAAQRAVHKLPGTSGRGAVPSSACSSLEQAQPTRNGSSPIRKADAQRRCFGAPVSALPCNASILIGNSRNRPRKRSSQNVPRPRDAWTTPAAPLPTGRASCRTCRVADDLPCARFRALGNRRILVMGGRGNAPMPPG